MTPSLSRSLLEAKRTSLCAAHMSASDPKRTLRPVGKLVTFWKICDDHHITLPGLALTIQV
jgi:hypothetical protein